MRVAPVQGSRLATLVVDWPHVYLVTNLLDEVALFLQFFSKGIDLFLLFRHLELLFDKRPMLFENSLSSIAFTWS